MTYPAIKLPILFVAFAFSVFPQWANASCNIQSTPLVNAGRCAEYVKLDQALNAHYKKAMQRLNPELKQQLREIQREWIRWRDDKCDEVQDASGCNENGLCNGVAHDYCIYDLTAQRDRELQKIWSNPGLIGGKSLLFSKEYK